jgi:hypothetical protein
MSTGKESCRKTICSPAFRRASGSLLQAFTLEFPPASGACDGLSENNLIVSDLDEIDLLRVRGAEVGYLKRPFIYSAPLTILEPWMSPRPSASVT